jgi:hypothetical protein
MMGVVSVVIVLAAYSSLLQGATITVDDDGPADFNSIQAAIDSAMNFDVIVVYPGIYYENITFFGKAVTITSIDPNDPNIVNSTIINGNNTENVITFCNAESLCSVISGLIIRNGDIGVFCEGIATGPQIDKCIVSQNRIGITCSSGAIVTINDTTISNNVEHGTSDCSGIMIRCSISGNGLDGLHSQSGIVTDCRVSNNMASGVYCYITDLNLINCNIFENGEHGICVTNPHSQSSAWLSLQECTVSGNNGSGICCFDGGAIDMTNCIVSGNGWNGIYSDENSGSVLVSNSTIVGNNAYGLNLFLRYPILLQNNIIGQNRSGGIYIRSTTENSRSNSIVNYNNFFANGGSAYSGAMGMISVKPDMHDNPLFAANGYWDLNGTPNDKTDDVWVEGDYHLMSTVGRWDPASETWVKDPIDSPCLDMGDPSMPFGDEPYPHGGRLNLGAYGGTSEASMTVVDRPVCTEYPEMDFNRDCKVDQLDLDIFMEHWLECNLDDPNACTFVQ